MKSIALLGRFSSMERFAALADILNNDFKTVKAEPVEYTDVAVEKIAKNLIEKITRPRAPQRARSLVFYSLLNLGHPRSDQIELRRSSGLSQQILGVHVGHTGRILVVNRYYLITGVK